MFKKMEIRVEFDQESSKISEKIIFSCEGFELHHNDITELKKKKFISYVVEETLPRVIPCQILVFIENSNRARIVFFNQRFVLPLEVFDEPFLNKNLIDRHKTNGWFRMEFTIPLHNKHIKLDFSLKI